jgi:hypothetical protein
VDARMAAAVGVSPPGRMASISDRACAGVGRREHLEAPSQRRRGGEGDVEGDSQARPSGHTELKIVTSLRGIGDGWIAAVLVDVVVHRSRSVKHQEHVGEHVPGHQERDRVADDGRIRSGIPEHDRGVRQNRNRRVVQRWNASAGHHGSAQQEENGTGHQWPMKSGAHDRRIERGRFKYHRCAHGKCHGVKRRFRNVLLCTSGGNHMMRVAPR